MIRVQFKIDKRLLAYRFALALFAEKQNKKNASDLRRQLQKEYSAYPGYYIFVPRQIFKAIRLDSFALGSPRNSVLLHDPKVIEEIFMRIADSNEFNVVYEKTQRYRTELTRDWKKHAHVVYPFLLKRTGSVGKTLHAFIFPPDMRVGSYLGNQTIEWGIPDIYPSYSVIGLAHELLHALTEGIHEKATENEKWLLHALIYLAADEELRHTLFHDTGYFSPEITKHYDIRLVRYAKKIFTPYMKQRAAGHENIPYLFYKLAQMEP